MELLNKEFQTDKKKLVKSISSEVYCIKHKPTGMDILYVSNNDKNKVFMAAFKTPPFDNSGAPHILEHSVLCGSKKYCAKDLFNELMKGSVNTFLNAMTFSDKTIYPIASQNDKDFFNLMDVYLDSVFNPLLSETPEFFLQEGWSYGISKRSSPIEIRGIVYNEMKGAYDNPERLLIKKIDEALYKNTAYEYDAGGAPNAIPTLTFNKLIHFYDVFYSPSNSLIYLYGDLDINKALDMISAAIYKRGKTHVPKPRLMPQITENIGVGLKKGFYSVNEKKEKGYYYALSFPACDYVDYYTSAALEMLSFILSGNDASPLRSVMCKSGVCGDFSSYYRTSSRLTSFSFVGKNCVPDGFDEFARLILSTLKKTVDYGIDKDLIDAAINKWDFFINEEDYGVRPRGLHYGILAASAWVYGGSAYSALDIKKTFSKIKRDAYNGLFEKLINEYLICNNAGFKTILEPETGLLQKEEIRLKAKLSEFKKSLTKDELNGLVKQSKALDKFRNKPVPKRVLRAIPSLSPSDVPRKTPKLIFERENNNVYCKHDKDSISYINLYFDLSRVPIEVIPYCGLLCEILGKTATSSYSAEKIINRLNAYAGGVRYAADALQKADGKYFPRLCIKIKTLDKNAGETLRLISEIIAPKLEISDVERITRETLIKMEANFLANGHSISALRALSYIFPYANYKDLLSGIGIYNEICCKPPYEINARLKEAVSAIFQRQNMSFGIASDGKSADAVNGINELSKSMSNGGGETVSLRAGTSRNEGFIFDGGVCFNASAFNLYDVTDRYSGKLLVAKSVLNLHYLWPEIRNKMGAYGCGSSFARDGSIYFYSYRDPELIRTFEAFDNSFDALAKYKTSEKEFQRYIINTIKPFERPLKPHEELELAVTNSLLGITDDMRQLERDEILSASQKDINNIGETLSGLTGKGYICSIGEKSKIERENIFSSVKKLRVN